MKPIMTLSRAGAVPSLDIDISKTYKLDAGQCEKCGYYKTWGFRVLNPKSGKMMPGHVTSEGYKLGDGNCPFWLARKDRGEGQVNVVDPTPAHVSRAAPAGNSLFTVDVAGKRVMIDQKQAIAMLKQLIDQIS